MALISRLLPVAALLFTFSAFSAADDTAHHHHAMNMSAEQPVWQSEGVVKKSPTARSLLLTRLSGRLTGRR